MIIQSLLDTDFYKITMMQVVYHYFPRASVEYLFKCRTPGIDFRPYVAEIQAEINQLDQLRCSDEEVAYLRSLGFFKEDFLALFKQFRFDPSMVHLQGKEAFSLRVRGPWLQTILFEVPLLAIISEIYSREQHFDREEGEKRLQQKVAFVKDNTNEGELKFCDFGTRRRYSFKWQQHMVATFKQLGKSFIGTSNTHLAKAQHLKPIGTMAHEYIQACQALTALATSQRYAFEMWAKEYRGSLGIALSDTYSLQAFLRDFDLALAKLYDGARHDSGDPFVWGDSLIAHYEALSVDPKTKTLVFSDSLTIPRAFEIYQYFKSRTNTSFGIGTNLSNDFANKPLDMVIKMVKCNGQPVAKISDTPGKAICEDEVYMAHLRKTFGVLHNK